MARYSDPVCRLCRREGIKLYLKAERCMTAKCAIERRAYAPGQHGQTRPKFSEYGIQLREKQKLRRVYGVLEKQFQRYFDISSRKKGVTGEYLLSLLERRIDNVIYRLGMAGSRSAARQLVLHNHFRVNGKKVNIPSYLVKPGDVISPSPNKMNKEPVKKALEGMNEKKLPHWLAFDMEKKQGLVQSMPTREDINIPVQEQLVVEHYSR
ncbi:MAG: 30S ribosomal protein S4 [Nitrospinae bacterium]|nr:30S ribosomal protein S4 [Nitrospinota bacterium]